MLITGLKGCPIVGHGFKYIKESGDDEIDSDSYITPVGVIVSVKNPARICNHLRIESKLLNVSWFM